jgi:hypothetical protein
MNTRQSKRQQERQKCMYQLKHAQIEKRIVCKSELMELVQDCKDNKIAKFGLVKISTLNLNDVIEEEEKTLIEYASFLKRDAIVSHLLKSGVDVTISKWRKKGLQIRDDVVEYLWNVHTSFATFIVHLVVQFRSRPAIGKCITCFKKELIFHIYPCMDIFCEDCFWIGILNTKKFSDCHCVSCNHLLLLESFQNNPKSFSDTEIISIIHETKEKFDNLPENAYKIEKKQKFQALPMSIISSNFLGTTKKQRCELFLDAIYLGNFIRVCAIIREGIDMSCKNEYGQNGLFLAVWKKHTEIVMLLKRCGANFERDDSNVSLQELEYPSFDIECKEFVQKGSLKSLISILNYPIHPGAVGCGSFIIDDCITDDFINKLMGVYNNIPIIHGVKDTCNDRKYICDSTNWISSCFTKIFGFYSIKCLVYPQMRFLIYQNLGGFAPPHIDLSRTNEFGLTSTHTFILYLTDCEMGGETNLLLNIPTKSTSTSVIESIKPKKARLLLFPHNCPHEGMSVKSLPKILLRGECHLEFIEPSSS